MPKNKKEDSQKNWLIALLILILAIAVYFIFFDNDVLLGPEEDKAAFQEAKNLNQGLLDACNEELNALENPAEDVLPATQEEIDAKRAECEGYNDWIDFYQQKINDMDDPSRSMPEPIPEPPPAQDIEFLYG